MYGYGKLVKIVISFLKIYKYIMRRLIRIFFFYFLEIIVNFYKEY